MKPVLLNFSGLTIEGVQQDAFNLCEIGSVSNERASDVTWCNKSQQWIAVIRKEFRHGVGPHVFCNKSREKCIEMEIKYLRSR